MSNSDTDKPDGCTCDYPLIRGKRYHPVSCALVPTHFSPSDTGKPCPTCGKYTTNPYNDLGECITCGRDRILGSSVTPPEQGVKESLTPTQSESELGADKELRDIVANSGLPYGRPRGDLYRAVRAFIALRERAARIEETWELEDHLTRHALDTSVGQKAIEFLNRRRDELTKGDK